MVAKLAELDAEHLKALAGGGAKYVARHHDRGKMTARERIEALVDPDSPFLELSPLAAWGTDFTVGASVVTGIGVVSGWSACWFPTIRPSRVAPATRGRCGRSCGPTRSRCRTGCR